MSFKFSPAYILACCLLMAPAVHAADSSNDGSSTATVDTSAKNASVDIAAKIASEKNKKESAAGSMKIEQKEELKEVKSEAVSEVDGVNLDKEEEKKGFSIGDLNPLKWIFKPVTDTQKEVKRLGKRITQIETPITDLQKPAVGLRQDMVNVHSEMGEIRGGITNVRDETAKVDQSLAKVEQKLNKIYHPVVSLKEPVQAMSGPVNNVRGNIEDLTDDMKGLKEVVSFTSTAILIAVIGAGLLVVVGTPIGALLVYRNRSKIMKLVGGTQEEVQELNRNADNAKSEATNATP